MTDQIDIEKFEKELRKAAKLPSKTQPKTEDELILEAALKAAGLEQKQAKPEEET